MTEETKNRLDLFIDRWGALAGRVSAIGTALVLIWSITVGPVSDWIRSERAETETITELKHSVTDLAEDFDSIQQRFDHQDEIVAELKQGQDFIMETLDEATRPDSIFEVNLAASAARDGFCIEREQCIIDLRVRRTHEGLACRIIPGSEKYFFVEEENGARIQVTMENGTPSTQIGREWFDYHRTFETPPGMEAPIGFMYEASYQYCRGESDTTIVVQESPVIPIEVRSGPGHPTIPPQEDPI